jgi:hypothetical protein
VTEEGKMNEEKYFGYLAPAYANAGEKRRDGHSYK